MSTPFRIALALFALCFASACREIIPPSPDGGGTDLGVDMTAPVDLGPCGMCGSAQPHCNADADGGARCVECINDTHCDAGHCDPETNTCVACFQDTHCLLAATSRCNLDTHSCAVCNDNAQCEHITDKHVCATEGCVECTHEQRDACADGANVCNSMTHQCEERAINTRSSCDECVSDDDCREGRVCVAMTFGSPATSVGNFCLYRRDATGTGAPNNLCSNVRMYTRTFATTTIDNVSTEVCAPLNETTCPAVTDAKTQVCSGETPDGDASCGAGLGDAFCYMVNASETQCTIPCGEVDDCKIGTSCDTDLGRCVWE